jgi:hypothetical protein
MPNQGRNHVSSNFGIPRDDQRPSGDRFGELEVATLLACLPLADLFEHVSYLQKENAG